MNLQKIILVLKREYLVKVRSRTFIISTILTPLAFILFFGIVIWLSISESETEKTIGIVDQTELIFPKLADINQNQYVDASGVPIDTLRKQVLDKQLDGYIIIDWSVVNDNQTPEFIHGGSGGINLITSIRSDLRDAIREVKLNEAGVSEEVRDIFATRVGLEARKLTEEGEQADNTVAASAFGFILGLLIFVGLFAYGGILMQSIIEEKTNRIVEVIASSVKPIELMTGKLLGVCLIGLTQFGIWIMAYIGLSLAAAPVAGIILEAQTKNLPEGAASAAGSFDPEILNNLVFDPSIFLYFFLFFVVGFLIYSAVFASIGAAVENQQDTQQFMFPVMIPIMIGYFFNLRVMEDPDSKLAVIASLIPLTAPINMVTRIAITDVPLWQIVLSLSLMVLTFMGLMWLGAKIYRVGILMYGKKPSFGELAKWVRQG